MELIMLNPDTRSTGQTVCVRRWTSYSQGITAGAWVCRVICLQWILLSVIFRYVSHRLAPTEEHVIKSKWGLSGPSNL